MIIDYFRFGATYLFRVTHFFYCVTLKHQTRRGAPMLEGYTDEYYRTEWDRRVGGKRELFIEREKYR